MSFMFRPTTPGRFMDIRSRRGLFGTRIPESGSAARISPSASASESAGTEALDGAGVAGDSIGITAIHFMAAAGITPVAGRSITGALTIGEGVSAADLTLEAQETGLPVQGADAAEFTTVPVQRPSLSKETTKRLEDTPHLAVRAEPAPALLATMIMAENPGVIRHAEARASAEGDLAAADSVVGGMAVGIANRTFVMFLVDAEI